MAKLDFILGRKHFGKMNYLLKIKGKMGKILVYLLMSIDFDLNKSHSSVKKFQLKIRPNSNLSVGEPLC